MADLQTLESALRKAHEAGDTDAAKVFASEIIKMRSAQPAAAQPPLSSPPAPESSPVEKADKQPNELVGGRLPLLGGQQQPRPIDTATKVLRGGEMFARGFAQNAGDTLASVADVAAIPFRKLLPESVSRYMTSEPGVAKRELDRTFRPVGEFVSSPLNRAGGYTDSDGESTGKFGPSAPRNTMEKALRGAGEGLLDAGSMVVPAGAIAKMAKAGTVLKGSSQAIASQPVIQGVAGMADKAVAEVSDSDLAGLSAGIVTGLSTAGISNYAKRRLRTNDGQRKMINVLGEMGDGDVDAGADIAKRQMDALGQDTALLDVAGIRGEKLARATANVPKGRAPEIVDDFVTKRQGRRGDRLQESANKIAPNEMYPELVSLKALKEKESAPLYRKAFAPRSDNKGRVYAPWDERLDNLLKDPDIKKGIAYGIRIQQRDATANDTPFNFKEFAVKGFDENGDIIIDGTPNLRTMDAGKRGLDAMINDAKDIYGNIQWTEDLRSIDNLRKKLVEKLDDITTDESGKSLYKAARDAYAGPSQLEDALWLGRKFLKGDEEVTQKLFADMSDGAKRAFRLGARREVSEIINTDTQTALTKFADKKATLWTKLRTVFPSDDAFESFRTSIQDELGKAQREKFINPRAMSPTAGIQQDVAELGKAESVQQGKDALGIIGNIATGNWITAMKGGLNLAGQNTLFEALARPNANTAEIVAETLLEMKPAARNKMIDTLQSLNRANPQMKSMNQVLLGAKIAAGSQDLDE